MRRYLIVSLNLTLVLIICQTTFANATSTKILIDSVNPDEIKSTIYDLQKNVKLDQPDIAYESRFALRVKNTNNPSDSAFDNSAEYIYEKFKSYGLDVEYDPFILSTGFDPRGRVALHGGGTYEVRNIIATLHGTDTKNDSLFIICAHYDSCAFNSRDWFSKWKTMEAPGANDNASGVSCVLESARILSKTKPDTTIKFIAFAGEELGLVGSKHYVNSTKESIAGVLNMDTIGYEKDAMDISIDTDKNSKWLLKAITDAKKDYDIDIGIDDTPLKDFEADHLPFRDNDISAVWINETGKDDMDKAMNDWGWHTTSDKIENLNIEFIARITQLTIATLSELANSGESVNPQDRLIETWGQIKK
jgi:hypothetical protein